MFEEKDILTIITTGSLTLAGLLLIFLGFFVNSIERSFTMLGRLEDLESESSHTLFTNAKSAK